jgi:D-Tyr-tRNAtyr deacylase
MVIPNILLETVLDPDRIDYMTALYGIAEKNVGIVICNNLAHLKNLLRVINDKFEMIVGDVRNGTISYDLSEEEKTALLPTLKADPERAEELYRYVVDQCKKSVPSVQTGEFGAEMKVSLVNDGPFTIILDEALA